MHVLTPVLIFVIFHFYYGVSMIQKKEDVKISVEITATGITTRRSGRATA